MKIWILKALLQKAISLLPASHQINYLFQQYITKGVSLTDDYFCDKLAHCKKHLYYFKKYSPYPENYTAMELGTGWYPIVPMGLFLNGAEEIYTIDITSLLKKHQAKEAIRKFVEYEKTGKLADFIPGKKTGRWETLLQCHEQMEQMNLQEILRTFKISSLVKDVRSSELPSHSIDLIVSNNTLEHIHAPALTAIFNELKRITKRGGVMSHAIDMSDHFAHLDTSISVFNFLRFSDKMWSFIDNSIQPQNRLRITDYRHLYRQLGIEITEESNHRGKQEELQQIRLNEKYQPLALEDTLVIHSSIISRM